MTLTKIERAALESWWHMPIRCRNGNIEAKKGECWGVLCSIAEGKRNAQIILQRAE